MSRIVIGKSKEGAVSLDLGVLLKTRLLVQAGSGAGKSYLIRLLCEKLFGRVQIIVLDREGEFASLREKFPFLLVGDVSDGADTPADIRSARLLAEKLLELRASAICDLYETFRRRPMDRREWVANFLEGLMDAPKKLWRPLLIILDEGHLFVPEQLPKAGTQRDREIISRCKDAVTSVATAGRKRGYALVLATQRLAKVDKDTSAELLNRLVGQTIEDVDADRACDLMSVTRDERRPFRRDLKDLLPGNFFAFGRALSKDRVRVKIGKVVTTHPESGSTSHAAAPPPPPDKIRHLLPKLKDLPAEVDAKAKNEAALRQEIIVLKRQLAEAERRKSTAAPPAPKTSTQVKVKQVEVPVLKKRAINELHKLVKRMEKAKSHLGFSTQAVEIAANAIARAIGDAVDGYEKLQESSARVARGNPGPGPCPPGQKGPRGQSGGGSPQIVSVPFGPCSPVKMEEAGLLKGERKMLEVLAQFHPGSRTRSQIGALTDLTPRGGTFGNYFGRLKRKGYIREQVDGSVVITDEGVALYGGRVPKGPQTPEELVEMWRGKLLKGERDMLEAVMGHYPEAISREDLGAEVGKAHTGGTFGNYLGTLRRNQLIVVDGDQVRAADVLFKLSGSVT